MSQELFQLVTIGLLGAAVLALVGILASIKGLRKTIARAGVVAAPVAAEVEPDNVAEPAPEVEGPVADPAAERLRVVPEGPGAAPTDPPPVEAEEQPFERDGQWWFRRGEELLRYDEQAARWVQAAAPAANGAGHETAAVATVTAEASGSLWRCPSCGAVNGSTATSCRMCFTTRA